MGDIIWKPFDISRYVNYKRDEYEFAGEQEVEVYPWILGYAHRTWVKQSGIYQYQIVETDVQPSVDYIVNYPSEDGVIRFGTNALRHVGRITWSRRRGDCDWLKHRDDGPAVVRINQHEKLAKAEWWINNVDISKDVRQWIKSMNLPQFYRWTTEHKMLFKLAFA